MSETALVNLRHAYAQLVNGGVKDSAQAERLACGLISPAIQALEDRQLETAQLQARVAELEAHLRALLDGGTAYYSAFEVDTGFDVEEWAKRACVMLGLEGHFNA